MSEIVLSSLVQLLFEQTLPQTACVTASLLHFKTLFAQDCVQNEYSVSDCKVTHKFQWSKFLSMWSQSGPSPVYLNSDINRIVDFGKPWMCNHSDTHPTH